MVSNTHVPSRVSCTLTTAEFAHDEAVTLIFHSLNVFEEHKKEPSDK